MDLDTIGPELQVLVQAKCSAWIQTIIMADFVSVFAHMEP